MRSALIGVLPDRGSHEEAGYVRPVDPRRSLVAL